MEFNLFQLLILLFIFYPLIKRLLGGLKGAENETGETGEVQSRRTYQQHHDLDTADRQPAHRPSRNTAEQKGEQSWEDFFEGLEKVLSGDEQDSRSQTRESSPARRETLEARREPVRPARRASDLQRSGEDTATCRHPSHGPLGSSGNRQSNPFTYKQDDQREIGRQGDELSQELEEGDNPIYQTLDESPEVVIIGTSSRNNVKRILNDPEKLRDGIVLKEILEPHRSRRRIHHAS